MPNGAQVEVPVQKENYVPLMQKVERPGLDLVGQKRGF